MQIFLDKLPQKIGYKDYAVGDYISAPKLVKYLSEKLKAKNATIHHADFSRHRALGKAGIDDDDDTIINYLHQWHVVEKGWKGIGYHLVIVPDGRLLLAYRGLIGKTGAHTKGKNTGNIGVLVWGDFQVEFPRIQQVAMVNIVRTYLDIYYDGLCFKGHGEWSNWSRTSCPGKNFPLRIWH